MDRIRHTGVIEACTVVEAPYVIKDGKTGKLSGVYVDVADMIAEKMNAKISWHETTFGNATADLASNRCDLVATAIYATIPRAVAVSFIQPPLAYQGISGVVRKDNKRFSNVESIYDFDRPGVVVSVATGAATDGFVTEHFKNATIKRIDVEPSNLIRHLMEVSASRADIGLYTMEECENYAKNHSEVKTVFIRPPIALFPICWAVRQDDLKWQHFIETALQFLDTQGTTAQLEKKYKSQLLHIAKKYELQ